MPEALPPFSGDDAVCPKCGNEGASTAWWCFGRIDAEHVSLAYPDLWPERLHRECRRCSYGWDEAVVGQSPTTDGAGVTSQREATVGEIPTVEPAPTTVDVYGDDTSWMLPLIDQYANGQRVTLPEHAVSYSANFNRLDLFASTFSVHLEDGSTLTRKWSVLP